MHSVLSETSHTQIPGQLQPKEKSSTSLQKLAVASIG
jgi:hypothetical protein